MDDDVCPGCGAAITGVVCGVCRRALTLALANRDLSGQPLAGADLRNADLTDANLAGADLANSDLRGAKLAGANVRGANLEGAMIDNLYAQVLTGVRLKGYRGTPAWVDPNVQEAPVPDHARWSVKGYPVRCPCCGGEEFARTRSHVDTHAWFDGGRSWMLTCAACTRVDWFRAEPTTRP
ncbi:MAG: pentapeptide repeat-containing protein [Deltaproteobacteria bacterium]|nr:pentapeptide repeat-containing protein [Deltaproteobacteria bacterium]